MINWGENKVLLALQESLLDSLDIQTPNTHLPFVLVATDTAAERLVQSSLVLQNEIALLQEGS